MRIEMQEREAVMFTGHRLDERPGDEMIAADRDQPTTVGDRICGRLPDTAKAGSTSSGRLRSPRSRQAAPFAGSRSTPARCTSWRIHHRAPP